MLRTRIISAAVLAPIVLLLIWLHPLTCLFAMIVMAAVGGHEFAAMARQEGYLVLPPVNVAIGAGFVTAVLYSSVYLRQSVQRFDEAIIIGVIVLLLGLMTWWLVQRGPEKPAIEAATKQSTGFGLYLFSIAYASLPLGLAAIVRALGRGSSLSTGPGGDGFIWLLVALFGTWSADTGAYFAGRALGRHKLAPMISPSKTIEGAIGGVLVATLVVTLTTQLLTPALPLTLAIPLGIIISIASILGDLFESFAKRRFHTKDSGTIIPGHGGVLDRIDALLFVFIVVAAFTLVYTG